MTWTPDTRHSLIVRLKDPADEDAWREFVDIYRPVVYRLARRRGLQDADAEDLVQQVMVTIAGAISRFEPDQQRARFRTWLHRIAQNMIINALNRRAPDRGSGKSEIHNLLDHAPQQGPDSRELRMESRRAIFRWAAQQIQDQYQVDTWQAFWLTAVEERDVNEVARLLGCNPGSVYAARSRIMRRLKQKVQEYLGEFEGEL